MMREAARFLKQHDDLMLIAHISPDGDTLGSSLALYAVLTRMGKRVQVVCADPVPYGYRLCPLAEVVRLPEQARETVAVVAVDCADLARTGRCASFFEHAAHTLCIDHHGTNRGFAQKNVVRAAGATGELIYLLFKELEVEIDETVATLLYVALAADTGNFSYSNTTPETFRIAASLLEAGLDLPEWNRRIFRTTPYAKALLQAETVQACRLDADGRIAVSVVTLSDLSTCGATEADTEGLIDSLRDIETVEIAALVRESADGTVRVSLRGKRSADVSRIAVRFGGGGHRLAAGCTMRLPVLEAAEQILAAAKELLSEESH